MYMVGSPDHLTDADVTHFWGMLGGSGSNHSARDVHGNIQRIKYWDIAEEPLELAIHIVMACHGIWKLSYPDRVRLLACIRDMAQSEMYQSKDRAVVMYNAAQVIEEAIGCKIGRLRLMEEQMLSFRGWGSPLSTSSTDRRGAGGAENSASQRSRRGSDLLTKLRRACGQAERAHTFLEFVLRAWEKLEQLSQALGASCMKHGRDLERRTAGNPMFDTKLAPAHAWKTVKIARLCTTAK